MKPHILIIVSRFYEDIADQLISGACGALKEVQATYDVVSVPGALEIPQALSQAIDVGLFDSDENGIFDGCVVLGCVIRGETSHYDIVAQESAARLQQIACRELIPLGNGILTVENQDQAIVRADPQQKNKGKDAAIACLQLIDLAQDFQDMIAGTEKG